MQEITIKITINNSNESMRTNALLIEDAIKYYNDVKSVELETLILNTKES